MSEATSRALAIAALALVGCGGGNGAAGDIRDLRPLAIERGDTVTVEAEGPLFTVGQPAVVKLPALGIVADGRAVSETRVLFDADDLFATAGAPRRASTDVVVEQGGRAFGSAAPFEVSLFPRTLHSVAASVAASRPGWPTWLFAALAMLLAAALAALPVPILAGLIVVWERKISAWMQVRVGPNRVGPNGWLQWLADGLKLLLKEDLVPNAADPHLFRAAPYLAFVGVFLVFAVLPFAPTVIAADLDVGVLFLLSATALVVVSILLGGWSSNSKWSLLGGMRSAAQIVSYELPSSMALLTIVTITGSLSTQAIVRAQGGWPWDWNLFRDPFTWTAFFIYFISSLAEGNRTPFDLPEAESELVSGFNTEYSGFRFSLFPLVEWVNLFVIGALAGMLFCGGWRLPGITVAQQESSAALALAGAVVYLIKIVGFIFVIIWIRWTLPRFRVDQMMALCWKYLLPFAFACFLGELLCAWLLPPVPSTVLRLATFLVGGVIPLAAFARRVRGNRARFRELKLNPLG